MSSDLNEKNRPWREDTEEERRSWSIKIAETLARGQVETLKNFLDSSEEHARDELKELDQIAATEKKEDWESDVVYEQYLGSLDSRAETAREIVVLATQLAMVGLYRVVELEAQRLLRWRYSEGDVDQMFRDNTFPRILRRDLNLNVREIKRFRSVDEVRLISNAVKHKGEVTAELARFPGWKEGDKLNYLRDHFDRLAWDIPRFIEDFCTRMIAVT